MIFTTEYSTVFKTSSIDIVCYSLLLNSFLEFDKGMQIKGNFTPIILSLGKLNYLLMLSMLFSNIIFEDKKDSYFTTASQRQH